MTPLSEIITQAHKINTQRECLACGRAFKRWKQTGESEHKELWQERKDRYSFLQDPTSKKPNYLT